MAVEERNKLFEEVYNKVSSRLESYIFNLVKRKELGFQTDVNELLKLNIIIVYLDNIKNSKYTYYYINNLTSINNYLNTI